MTILFLSNIPMLFFRRPLRCACALLLFTQLATANAASSIDGVVRQDWIKAESANFRVVTEQPEDVARMMVTDLENLRYISSRVRGAQVVPGPPLTIVAMGRNSFPKLGLPKSWGGVFNLSRMGYAALANVEGYTTASDSTSVARTILLHEYHHFLLRMSPETLAYPKWYNEGMSEYWSSLTIRDGRAWFGHPVEGVNREYWLHDRSGAINFDTKDLFSATRFKYDDTRGANEALGRFYARARYAVHYFNATPERRAQLDDYLRLVNLGFSQDQAVRLAFKSTYADLDRDMRRYVVRKLTARGFKIGKDGLDLPSVQVTVAKLDRAATYAALADVVPRFTRRGSAVAKELVETSLQLNPDDPDALATAVAARMVDAPGPRVVEALKRFPRHSRLLALRADALSRGAFGRRGIGATDWQPQMEEARQLFRQAIGADPDNGLAYFGLGFVYTALENAAPDEGIVCLDTATIYEPRPAVFLALARLYLRKQQLPEALRSMRSAVAFGAAADRPLDALIMENLELLSDLQASTPTATGLSFKSGSVYEGPLRDGKPDGKGKWIRPNGSYYEGVFVDGLPSGQGKLASERGVVYEGEFAAGVARGSGRITFPAGSRMVSYEGGVDYGFPNGAGELVTKNGRLQAAFREGDAHGSGTFTPSGKPESISGTWYFGLYDWPALDSTAFTGGIDANGRRNGAGWCRAPGATAQVEACQFRDGKPVELGTPTDEDED
jgi:hypothetical protein